MPDAGFLHSKLLASHGAIGIFSLRHGGMSHPPFDSLNPGSGLGDDEENITRNMDLLIRQAGLPGIPHRARQMHGTHVLVCHGKGSPHHRHADILIGMDGASVSVRVADCVPVLLADPAARMIAAIHAGWRGTAARIVIHAVAAMQRYGANPARILAFIGPSIGSCCFEIDTSTAKRLSQCCDGAHRFIHHSENTVHADLAGINTRQLNLAGVTQSHIEQVMACTCCDEKYFYSWRRDGKQSGRHLAVVALPDAP